MNYVTNEVQDNQQRGLLSAMFGDSRKMGLDKSALIRKIADAPDKTVTAYTNGMTVLKKMKATNEEVAAAVAAFN